MAKEEKNMKKRLVLLDAHAILHRAYHALPDFSTSSGEPTGALYGISAMLIKIIEDLRPDYMVSCYDLAGPTYRHEAYKDYKAGRKKAEDDLISQMKRSRDIFEALNVPIYAQPGFEADDILGTICEQMQLPEKKENIEIIVASGDMDTLQLVRGKNVQVYTLKKGINDTIMYDENAVEKRYGFGPLLIPDYKGLRGDPSDNIIGVKGIGEVTATAIIKEFGTIENMFKELESGHEDKFIKAGIKPRIIQLLKDNKEEAEFSKMLATIRRDVPIKFVLPEKTFKDALDVEKAKRLWLDLEFRTLAPRLQNAINSWPKQGEKESKVQVSNNKEEQESVVLPTVSPEEIEKVGTALWLIQSNLTNPALEDILDFARTNDFEKAKETIMVELKKRDLEKVFNEIELPLIPVTHKMEKRGIKIDTKELSRLSKTYHAELSILEKKIWEHAGQEFNINSPKQLGDILFDKLGIKGKNMKKTGAGARSTRESELDKIRDAHPIVPLLFEQRELSKLLSTYIDAIQPLLDQNNRLHTDFIPSGTTTGRMASKDPNMQNIPIKSNLGKAIRSAFIAEEGFSLAAFDYSQMELRIAAFLSGDEKLIGIFNRDEDVHSSVASQVFRVPLNEVTSEMRRQAKVINFGIIYGMGVMALKQNLGSTREAAQKFYEEYFQSFSTLAGYLDRVKAETERKGYTETFFGRRRYFEGIKSKIPYIKAGAERMAINAPIQGTEADVIKLAMVKIDIFIKENRLENDVFPLLQVHDELIYEIKKDIAEEIGPKIRQIMEGIIDPSLTHGVILKASYSLGDNWGLLS